MQTGKARFMKQNNDDGNHDILLCSVEELVLDHYKEAGYAQGLHGEGGTFSCLLCLLMWDIIFMPGVKDVFRTRYQSHPLDLYTDHFYEHRKDLIDRRLDDIISWNNDDFIVVDFISEIWNKYNGLACSGLNWERFASLEQVLSLVKCIGGEALSGILGTMVKDFRHTRSGLPDLVVWNDISYKLVEVKGPNDRLSTNQRVWIHKLMELGVDVEVCHVSAAASRKMIC
nr:fanconi-associated nuclease 1-like [Ciona intestinalis]|eukprot:XP_018671419.1 fanconi-associated nuclease 1-like [Ciona intestinalis]